MEDVPRTSSYLRNRKSRAQSRKIPEPPELYTCVCTTPLSNLSRTRVANLVANKLATGSYLLLRTLEPPVTGTVQTEYGRNLVILVEDHNETQAICCLQGQVHLTNETEFEELLPVNTVFVLKEPLLVACSEQDFAVIVGSPSAFVVVGRSHVLSKDVESLGWLEATEEEGIQLTNRWKQNGDDLFEKGKFCEAADAYLFALNNGADEETNILLNLNLSATFLSNGCYESAIKHALSVLEIRELNEKALYYCGRAHYELGQFKEAKRHFEKLKSGFTSNTEGLEELARCENRLAEAQGNVDVYKLYRACLTENPAPIDHGNFVGDVEFRPDPEKQVGVFATKNFEPGTLILVEKPLVAILEHSFSGDGEIMKFVQKGIRTVLKNPKSLGPKLYSLPGGGAHTDENRRLFCDEAKELEPIVDVTLVYNILFRNGLKTENITLKKTPFLYQLYDSASRFQHSCFPNCTMLFYNDLITIRTCSTVLKGEELFVRYFSNLIPYREKMTAIERSGYTCTCNLCTLDKRETDKVHERRKALWEKFMQQKALYAGVPSTGKHLPRIVTLLELIYKKRGSLRIILSSVYCDLARLVDRSAADWTDKVALYVNKGLQSMGLSEASLLGCVDQDNPGILHCVLLPEIIFEYVGIAAEKESVCGRQDLAEQWVKVLLLLERIFRGGNLKMLEDRFANYKEVQTLLSTFAQ